MKKDFIIYENLEQIDLYGKYKGYKWYLDLWHESDEPKLTIVNKVDDEIYEEYIDNAKCLMTMIISGKLDEYLKMCLDETIKKYETQREFFEKEQK
jgi:UDP-galactopyranose mutase